MKIRLDRTVCDGFGVCAKHAPSYFSLDDWGYASLTGDGTVADDDHDAVMRALLDCPVHAIRAGDDAECSDEEERRRDSAGDDADFSAHRTTDASDAERGVTR